MDGGDQSTDVQYETRFAVVMYGGISLAIYIYGVAQELYSMVRATAGNHGGAENSLTETEKVYRELGKHLHTKFVVDILSGTSAGGLNAIFLAKALANNQDFSALSKIWKDAADVDTLIYDDKSVKGLPVRFQVPDRPQYLMNSQRMTYLLLDGFNAMGKDPGEPSHFVNELDLYITATDFYGRDINLSTSDPKTPQAEKKYRKAFHLNYTGMGENDFLERNNPFLAFISRCTSAIPPAFETMTLKDIQALPNLAISDEELGTRWMKFFDDDNENGSYVVRPYADGGYLDNKPFTYATNALLNRTADVPVDRKLFYIEPSPEHFLPGSASNKKPNVIQNVSGALIGLPRYETIREDLEALHHRNDLIERMGRTLDDVESQFLSIDPQGGMPTISKYNWTKLSLKECIEKMGPSYGAYLSLRVNGLIEMFATDIANHYHIDPQSNEFAQIKKNVRQWFEKEYPSGNVNKKTWTGFLYMCDINWRVRRLNFLHRKINQLLLIETIINLNEDELMHFINTIKDLKEDDLGNVAHYNFLLKSLDVDVAALNEWIEKARKSGSAEREAIRSYFLDQIYRLFQQSFGKRHMDVTDLEAIKQMKDYYKEGGKKDSEEKARKIEEYMQQMGKWIENNPIVKNATKDVTSEFRELALAKEFGFAETLRNIKENINKVQNGFSDIRSTIKNEIAAKTLTSSTASQAEIGTYILEFAGQAEKLIKKERWENYIILGLGLEYFKFNACKARELVQCYLQTYYEAYEYFDKLTYPLVVANGLGEADIVDIWRISPDESNLVRTPKLGGQTVAHFGAFFKKEWRENDIMWGRLDGAEQIIHSLGLPADEEKEYVRRVQAAIIRDEAKKSNKKLLEILNIPDRNALPTDDQPLLEEFKKKFEIDLTLETKSTLPLAARSSQVAGKMFEGLSLEYLANNSFAKWITKIGQLFFWIVEMATADSWLHIIARNIFMLLYFAGFFLVAVGSISTGGGTVGGIPPVSRLTTFGWGMIGFTAFLQYANYIFSQILNGPAIDLRESPKKQKKPVQIFPPFVKAISLGSLLLLISYNSEGLIEFLSSTREILWLSGLAALALGLLGYAVYKAREHIQKIFNKDKGSLWTSIGLFAVVAISAIIMDWTFAPLKDKGHRIIDLELGNIAQKAQIIQDWAGKEKYIWWTLSIDFVFLIGLSAFLWFVWNRYSRLVAEIQGKNNLERFSHIMSIFAVMGGIFDVIENTTIMGILSGFSMDVLTPISLAATYLKFSLFALPFVLWPFFGLWIWGASAQKKQEDVRRPV